jgi:hypothetical protein
MYLTINHRSFSHTRNVPDLFSANVCCIHLAHDKRVVVNAH